MTLIWKKIIHEDNNRTFSSLNDTKMYLEKNLLPVSKLVLGKKKRKTYFWLFSGWNI